MKTIEERLAELPSWESQRQGGWTWWPGPCPTVLTQDRKGLEEETLEHNAKGGGVTS